MTAMGYRQYDSAIGRFVGMDLLSESSASATPYHFGYNNPVFWADPSGLLSQGAIDAMWNATGKNGRSTWTNYGGGFSSGSNNIDYEGNDAGEVLPEMVIEGKISKSSGRFSFSSSNLVGGFKYGLAEKTRDHAYQYGSAYQSRRDAIASRQLDEFEDLLSAYGNAPVIGEPFDALSGTISLFRGNYKKAGVSAFAMFPLVGNTAPALKHSDEIYDVYHGLDGSGAIKYVGITSRNPAVRFSEHAGSIGSGKEFLRYDVLSSGLTKQQARVMEQTIINNYGLQKNGGQLLNRINSIVPKNWAKNGIN